MILIYPDKLSEKSKVKMMLDYLQFPYTYNIKNKYDVVYNSNRKTKHDWSLKTNKFVINKDCNNTLKDRIDKLWEETTGRGLRIDPMTFKGFCVEKTLEQGTNSGKIIECPYKPKNGFIYLRWVDTRYTKEDIRDFRVVVIKGNVILVVVKPKKINELFGNALRFEEIGIKDVFSEKDIHHISEFSRKMKLDYGEMDILRSNFDGRIYCTDVNQNPGYGFFREKKYLNHVSNIFRKEFLWKSL